HQGILCVFPAISDMDTYRSFICRKNLTKTFPADEDTSESSTSSSKPKVSRLIDIPALLISWPLKRTSPKQTSPIPRLETLTSEGRKELASMHFSNRSLVRIS